MKTSGTGDEPDADVGQDLARLWSVLAHVVTPTTFVAALMVYFGSVRTNTLYRNLGVDQSLLGLSLQDYAMRSVGSTVEPLVMVLLGVLVALTAHTVLVRRLTRHRVVTRWFLVVLGTLGLAGATIGLLHMVGKMNWHMKAPFVPLCLAFGVLALAYSVSLHVMLSPARAGPAGPLRIVRRTVFAALLALLLLWSIAQYAELRGQDVADTFRRNPAQLSGVVVYAPQRLYLEGPGITESLLPDAAAKYRYRYAGLSLLTRSNQRYFLLPACWATDSQARAIALPDDPSLRLEFFPVRTHPDCPPA
ncbi:hypothetical protein [Nonomuraea sp. NPDC048826]|uniref:hypothetical protein n=1 Tax=Nonomuraea sp. NPDC048826 TaxID=3364347 RepID=UPI00371AF784